MKLIHKYDPTTKLYTEDSFLTADASTNITAPKTYTLPASSTYIQPVGFHKPKWNGTKWVEGDKPAVLVLAKAVKKSAILDAHSKALDAGVSYQGALFQSDTQSIQTLAETLTALGNGWTLPAGFAWIDAANTPHPADIVLLKGLSTAFADHKSALFARLQVAKAAITAATTAIAVNQVVL